MRDRELRWRGRAVRVTSPAPSRVWAEVAAADPGVMAFQTPAWRDCVVAGSRWRDASRLYETPDGRRLVLVMARRRVLPGVTLAASWPSGWGCGGVIAPGGPSRDEIEMISADLARDRAVSLSVRPGFAAAAVWRDPPGDPFAIGRAVRVVHLDHSLGTFEEFWAKSAASRMRRAMRVARQHQADAGVTITHGNSPELLAACYRVYLNWITHRARQRHVPAPIARWQGRRAEPFSKFTAAAAALGEDCRIWVAWWEGRPVGATISLYAGRTAIGWRAFTDRSVPGRFRLFEVMALDALEHAYDSGSDYLEMGESVGREDLSRIKNRFGAEEHEFAEYCFERLPLQPGRMAGQRLRRRLEDKLLSRGRRVDGQEARGVA